MSGATVSRMQSALASQARPVIVDRTVYGTIAVACVMVVYDGWAGLTLRDGIGVIVGPIIAMFVSHVFSAGLTRHVELERRLNRHEWAATVGYESRFLLLAVPPVAALTVLYLAGLSLAHCAAVVIWMEALSLGFWSGLAAARAGLRGWLLGLAVLAGLAVGAAVLVLQVFLQPGNASIQA